MKKKSIGLDNMKRFIITKINNNGNIVQPQPNKKHIVINIDEPYAQKVFELIRDHEKEKGTWDNTDSFEDFVAGLDYEP